MELNLFLDKLCEKDFVQTYELISHPKSFKMIKFFDKASANNWYDFDLIDTYELFVSVNGFIFYRSVSYHGNVNFLYSIYELQGNNFIHGKDGVWEGIVKDIREFEIFYFKNMDLFSICDSRIKITPASILKLTSV